jgi:molybdopterin-guanine dinucleotide biosynthesis protein A
MEGSRPLGVVLAGGAATRLGGSKANVELAGRPLISYPLAAFAAAGIDAVVVAKTATELPRLDVPVVTEPEEPHHPLLGLVAGLTHAHGRPIVTVPCDTPFVTATLVSRLAEATGTAAVHDGERLHPLLARYLPTDLPGLERALAQSASATATAEKLNPAIVEVTPEETFNVNTAEDLAYAASIVTRAL